MGVITVPDPRLDKLAEFVNPQRILPTNVDIVDIAGLIKGASKGEGLGNQFLGNIREVDAIIHVVRCFENDDIILWDIRPQSAVHWTTVDAISLRAQRAQTVETGLR